MVRKNGLSSIEIYILGSNYKIDKVKELKCDIFIEDNPLNAMQLAQGREMVFLLENNYNKHTRYDNITKIKY